MSQQSQVVVPDALESIVAVKIVAADVVCRVRGTDPSKGHGAQLGLKEKSILCWTLHSHGFTKVLQLLRKCYLTPSLSCFNFLNTSFRTFTHHSKIKKKKFILTESLTICSRFGSGESCSQNQNKESN